MPPSEAYASNILCAGKESSALHLVQPVSEMLVSKKGENKTHPCVQGAQCN